MTRKEKILGFMADDEYTPLKSGEICAILGVPKADRKEFNEIIEELEAEGKIYRNSKGRYTLIEKTGLIRGYFRLKAKGFGFITDSDGEEYFVGASDTCGALTGDTVLAKITKKTSISGKHSECRIVKIVTVGEIKVVGTYKESRNFGFVVPDNKAIGDDIFISKSNKNDAKNNQKVVATITKRASGDRNPEGVISEILGFGGEKGIDILSLLREYGYTDEFPEKVQLNAESFSAHVEEYETRGREDFREDTIITIDGDDSKDFDDAVSLKRTNSGFELGVHIADVSYYVTENSPLDIEALKRGTSVYLPGAVIPMLPKELSNGICSLNPDCDRLTLSVIMHFDLSGNLQKHRICESVIHSTHRMTYNNVTAILEGDKKLSDTYSGIKDMLFDMKELAMLLRSNRMAKGSIDFDFPEVKIELDENGKSIDVYKYKSTVSHQIIEEFMLVANTTVAEEMFWCEIPFVYRIHEQPSADKINAFSKMLSYLGYTLKTNRENPHPKAFADLLEKIKDTDKELIISKIMLRSLMKAKYSNENLGHFGLSFKYYCHFTSPIRRYPDLVIHRIIKEHMKNGLSEKRARYLESFTERAAKLSSEAEIKAMEAEREADDMKKTEFMAGRIGESFDAVISSVTSFGIFAETHFGIEGLVSLSELKDDYYEFNEKNLTLSGRHTGKTYSIGDKLRVSVKRANIQLREIDFEIINEGCDINE